MDLGQVSRIARLARLAPEIVEGCLDNRADGLALENVNRCIPTLDWREQGGR